MTNQKGGVGKTTTVANLGAMLAQRGRSVCLVDLDPQAHLTMHFRVDPATLTASTYEVMTAGVALSRAAVMVEPNLSLVPSTIDLAAAEVELAGEVGREQILRDRFCGERLPYEFILVDCPPSLGLLTLNALAATEEVLIPLQPHFLALQGLGRLLETVALVQRRINPSLKVAGVVFCMYESATRLASEVVEDVQGFFQAARGSDCPWSATHVFETRIRRNIRLAECPGHGTTIVHYDPACHGGQDYAALAEEFLRAAGEEPVAKPVGFVEEGERAGPPPAIVPGPIETIAPVATGDGPDPPELRDAETIDIPQVSAPVESPVRAVHEEHAQSTPPPGPAESS